MNRWDKIKRYTSSSGRQHNRGVGVELTVRNNISGRDEIEGDTMGRQTVRGVGIELTVRNNISGGTVVAKFVEE